MFSCRLKDNEANYKETSVVERASKIRNNSLLLMHGTLYVFLCISLYVFLCQSVCISSLELDNWSNMYNPSFRSLVNLSMSQRAVKFSTPLCMYFFTLEVIYMKYIGVLRDTARAPKIP